MQRKLARCDETRNKECGKTERGREISDHGQLREKEMKITGRKKQFHMTCQVHSRNIAN